MKLRWRLPRRGRTTRPDPPVRRKGLSEAEEQLQKLLDGLGGDKFKDLLASEVVPTNDPGTFVLKRACRCSWPPTGKMDAVAMIHGGGCVHHHLLQVSRGLWERVSEERGWPQRGYLVMPGE